mgnify:FL=1
MTYAKLLIDLKKAGQDTENLEAYVAKKIAIDSDEDHIGWATTFINNLVRESCEAMDRVPAPASATNEDWTANAYDTILDHGWTQDSLVGKVIFANANFNFDQ